jgi:hypothetical protein
MSSLLGKNSFSLKLQQKVMATLFQSVEQYAKNGASFSFSQL